MTFHDDHNHSHDHNHDHDHDHDHDHPAESEKAHEDTGVYALTCEVSTGGKLSKDEYHEFSRELMGAIADSCWSHGAKVIGHIKAYMESGDAFFYASTVGNPNDITVNEKGGEPSDHFRLTINSIVYGIEGDVVKNATEKAFDEVINKNGFSKTG